MSQSTGPRWGPIFSAVKASLGTHGDKRAYSKALAVFDLKADVPTTTQIMQWGLKKRDYNAVIRIFKLSRDESRMHIIAPTMSVCAAEAYLGLGRTTEGLTALGSLNDNEARRTRIFLQTIKAQWSSCLSVVKPTASTHTTIRLPIPKDKLPWGWPDITSEKGIDVAQIHSHAAVRVEVLIVCWASVWSTRPGGRSGSNFEIKDRRRLSDSIYCVTVSAIGTKASVFGDLIANTSREGYVALSGSPNSALQFTHVAMIEVLSTGTQFEVPATPEFSEMCDAWGGRHRHTLDFLEVILSKT